jgi:hypothetical protein
MPLPSPHNLAIASVGPATVPISGPPPIVDIVFSDLYGRAGWVQVPAGTPINRWVQVYWYADKFLAEFLNQPAQGNPSLEWPANEQEWLNSWEFCYATPMQVQMPQAAWDRLKKNKFIFRDALACTQRVKPTSGISSADLKREVYIFQRANGTWDWNFPFFELVHSSPIADAGMPRLFPVDLLNRA